MSSLPIRCSLRAMAASLNLKLTLPAGLALLAAIPPPALVAATRPPDAVPEPGPEGWVLPPAEELVATCMADGTVRRGLQMVRILAREAHDQGIDLKAMELDAPTAETEFLAETFMGAETFLLEALESRVLGELSTRGRAWVETGQSRTAFLRYGARVSALAKARFIEARNQVYSAVQAAGAPAGGTAAAVPVPPPGCEPLPDPEGLAEASLASDDVALCLAALGERAGRAVAAGLDPAALEAFRGARAFLHLCAGTELQARVDAAEALWLEQEGPARSALRHRHRAHQELASRLQDAEIKHFMGIARTPNELKKLLALLGL